MALFKHLRPVDRALDQQGPLSQAVPRAVTIEVNNKLKKAEATTKKRGNSSPTLASQMSLQTWVVCYVLYFFMQVSHNVSHNARVKEIV